MVIRDINITFIKTWVLELHCDGHYVAKVVEAKLALKIGESLQSETVIIEGDALRVIQCILNG